MGERDIYIAIKVAAARGKTMVLSVAEVEKLAMDEAINFAAINALDEQDPCSGNFPEWEKINPRRVRNRSA